jgi:hypothetical protein
MVAGVCRYVTKLIGTWRRRKSLVRLKPDTTYENFSVSLCLRDHCPLNLATAKNGSGEASSLI